MNLTEKALQWIVILREKPKMIFTGADDLYSFRMFIEGYIHGLSHALDINMMLDITVWIKNKMNQSSSFFWTDFLIFHNGNKSEMELKQILLQTFEDFILENAKWYEKRE